MSFDITNVLFSTTNFNEAVNSERLCTGVRKRFNPPRSTRFTTGSPHRVIGVSNAAFEESRYLEIVLSYVVFFKCSIVYDLLLYVVNSVFVVQNAILNNGLISQ